MFRWFKNLFKRKPPCTCSERFAGLSELADVGQTEYVRNPKCPQHGDCAALAAGFCPDCHSTDFNSGPEGGCARMIMCCGCGSQFTVEVLDETDDAMHIIPWGRVGD